MRLLANKRLSHAVRRRGIVAAVLAAFAGVFVVATALPAYAHNALVSGATSCSDGNHVITWTIGNSEQNLAMQITSAVARLGAETYPTTGYGTVPGGGTTQATTDIPGGLTGTVTLYLHGIWDDNFQGDNTGTVELVSGCTPETTTTEATTSTSIATTTTEASTSTTIATTTTEASTSTTIATTTTEAPTSTTAATSTTLPASTTLPTTPISTQGSTVQTTTTTAKSGALGSTSTSAPPGVTAAATPDTSTGALPFTGSSDSGSMIGLSSLVAGGIALALSRRPRRRKARTH